MMPIAVNLIFGLDTHAVLTASIVSVLILLVTFFLLFLISRAFDHIARLIQMERLAIRPFERIFRGLIALIALLLICSAFGLPLNGLWTALTGVLAMVAIGFVAAWSVLVNITCTMIILMFRPFRIGDTIGFPGEEVKGQVVDLTLIYTTLLGEDGRQFQVPNVMFLQKSISRIPCNKIGPSLAEQLQASEPANPGAR